MDPLGSIKEDIYCYCFDFNERPAGHAGNGAGLGA